MILHRRFIYADERRVKQIIINFLSNAVKFTINGGITIKYKAKNNNVYISVKDTGLGIKAEDLPKLFTEFCTIASHQTWNPNGTGLGLYLSRNLAKLMDGDITVKSVHHKGSKFTLQLPLTSNSIEENKEVEVNEMENKVDKGGDTVIHVQDLSTQGLMKDGTRNFIALVVDDSSISSFVISKMIQRYSVNSEKASNGKQAVELVTKKSESNDTIPPYSLIFMDINMPIMSGIEVKFY